jgi:hypothetical protein
MTPELAARLRHVLPGVAIPKNGVAGFTGVAAVARYAGKPQQLRQIRPLRVENSKLANDAFGGVAEGVAGVCDPEIEERAALAADGVPADYLFAWAHLQCRQPPSVEVDSWRRAINDGGLFLDAWGEQAAELGWTAGELFDEPGGLVRPIAGTSVAALGPDHVQMNDGRCFDPAAARQA